MASGSTFPPGASDSGVRAWLDPALARELGDPSPGELLERVGQLHPERFWRKLPGRETFAWPERAGVVVKRHRGDVRREWWYEALHHGSLRSPGRRECESLLALAGAGIPAPRALGWVEESPRRLRRSAALLARVPHETTLKSRLARASAAETRELAGELARLVARLHVQGFYHRDLYLEHLVHAAADGALVLLDAGRLRRERRPRERWFVKDLAALLHSAPPNVGERAQLRFLSAYLRERGVAERGSSGALVARIRAKARRLGAHEPRFSWAT
jgi:tRNA A-37 threonylcarbamoyl transferase component Bud32